MDLNFCKILFGVCSFNFLLLCLDSLVCFKLSSLLFPVFTVLVFHHITWKKMTVAGHQHSSCLSIPLVTAFKIALMVISLFGNLEYHCINIYER